MQTLAKVNLLFAAVKASTANRIPIQLDIYELPSGVQMERGRFIIFTHRGMEGNSSCLDTNPVSISIR
ncbi:hypothetical protein MA16_Dca009551 [Dendrobium catenatum]|uniref:Uncharacterized protein n=1 Tax=Dendrobium catenatum TaxID=906689 RepID=A0A2I0VRZ6_9ASPA|nr:hypothetical protein MA16_Dca009551 [Dendrobium catenatum]